jgi:hypothetical protein
MRHITRFVAILTFLALTGCVVHQHRGHANGHHKKHNKGHHHGHHKGK